MIDGGKMLHAVRGAICLDADTQADMQRAVEQLVPALLRANRIGPENIVSVVFSQTSDLQAANPASCLRRGGFETTALFCTQEPRYSGELERVVRVLVTFQGQRTNPVRPLYLNGAEQLRPDL